MTTYNTGNPVGSVDVRDLYDNAENLDKFANGQLDEYADRLGVSRQSLQGIRNASQYTDLGPYAAGLNFTARNQVFSYDAGSGAEFYAPGPAITLPYTTMGIGAVEIAKFRSVGDAILRQDLLAPDGAENVTHNGQDVAHWLDKFDKVIPLDVRDFGAVGDGVTEDSQAFRDAIVAATSWISSDWYNAGDPPLNTRFKVTASGIFKVRDLIIPQGLILDLSNCTLIGYGNGAGDPDMFTTGGYDAGGNLVSNIGTPTSTYRVVSARISGGRIRNTRKAFNLYNFQENSILSDITCYDCRQALIADMSFYGGFENITNRGTAGGATDFCIEFLRYVNAERIDKIAVNDRVNGIHFGGEVNGAFLSNISVEGGTNGLVFTAGTQLGATVGPLLIGAGCYFENLTGNAIQMADAAHAKVNVTIDNVFFNKCASAIVLNAFAGKVGSQNRFLNCPSKLYIDPFDPVTSAEIEINPGIAGAAFSNNGTPALPDGYTISPKCFLHFPMQTYDSGTGLPTTKMVFTGDNSNVPLNYAGNSGFVPGGVPYCTHSKTAGTTFSVLLDTRIAFNEYTFIVFRVKITDNDGVFDFAGRVYGSMVFQDGVTAGRTITVSNVGGFVRISFNGITNPSSAYGIEGVVRLT